MPHPIVPIIFCIFQVLVATAEIIQIDPVELEYKNGHVSENGPLKPVICSINTDSFKRTKSQFTVSKIDPSLCTHILYNAGRIRSTSKVYIADTDSQSLVDLKALKEHHNLNIILSIGGWAEGVKNFQNIAQNKTALGVFTKSIQELLDNGPFDSISIAWMWPGVVWRGGLSRDTADLVTLLNHLRAELPSTPISILINGFPSIADFFDLTKISDLVDMFLVFAQDYAGNWEGSKVTGHPSAVYGDASVDKIISHVLKSVNSSKVILGIPFFGRTFLLDKDSKSNGFNESFKGSFEGSFYKSDIEVGYSEVCSMVKDGASVYFDKDAKAMFLKQGRKWVGFDGILSVKEKVKYGLHNHLGGFLIHSVDTDDFDGKWCGGEKWALLKGVVGEIFRQQGGGVVDDAISGRNEHHHTNHTQSSSDCGLLLPSYFFILVFNIFHGFITAVM